jgi:hypothetical protein
MIKRCLSTAFIRSLESGSGIKWSEYEEYVSLSGLYLLDKCPNTSQSTTSCFISRAHVKVCAVFCTGV